MATAEECDAALARVVGLLDGADDSVRSHVEDRTVSLFVPDLDLMYCGRLHDGRLVDLTTDPQPRAQIRLTIHSDDLIELVEGRQHFAQAFGHGRVHIDASIRDMFRLRTLL